MLKGQKSTETAAPGAVEGEHPDSDSIIMMNLPPALGPSGESFRRAQFRALKLESSWFLCSHSCFILLLSDCQAMTDFLAVEKVALAPWRSSLSIASEVYLFQLSCFFRMCVCVCSFLLLSLSLPTL